MILASYRQIKTYEYKDQEEKIRHVYHMYLNGWKIAEQRLGNWMSVTFIKDE